MLKKCFVPSCSNDNKNKPNKIFLYLPKEESMRKLWFAAIKVQSKVPKTGNIFCCEDHFDLKEDSQNWIYFETIGAKLVLKKGAVPHQNLESNIPYVQPLPQESQFTSSARKRKSEALDNLTSIKKKQVLGETITTSISSGISGEKYQTPTKEKYTIHSWSPSEYFKVGIQKIDVGIQVNIKEKKHFRSIGVNVHTK